MTEDIEAESGATMQLSLKEIIRSYNAALPLADASAPPAAWYTDPRVFELEQTTVFAHNWQPVARAAQVAEPGQYIICEVANESILIVRGDDHALRAFFNVCRHKGAAIVSLAEGSAQNLRCPYHGWTYALDGQLKRTPDFAGVQNFDPSAHGLMPAQTAVWQDLLFVRLDSGGPSLEDFLGADLMGRIDGLAFGRLHWFERRRYTLNCNWKIFVDNYLDGGYHVPHLHHGLDSVLDYSEYAIETGERCCIQSSPIVGARSDPATAGVRQGDRALYFWIYPNSMINWYEGVMDTNLVIPRGVDRTEVIFDFYFADVSAAARQRNMASIAVSERIQTEDLAICESVQRGLSSRAYRPGRLSVRREAGEHVFHRLLYTDLQSGQYQPKVPL